MSILISTLKEINEMNAYSRNNLADRLKTSPGVLDHVLSSLQGMGYIKEESISISKCSTCPSFKNGCMGLVSGRPISTLAITEKGRDFLKTAN